MNEPKSSFDNLKYIGSYDRVADCQNGNDASVMQDR